MLEHKNDLDSFDNLEFTSKEDGIDWNNRKLINWQIIEPKDSLRIFYDD